MKRIIGTLIAMVLIGLVVGVSVILGRNEWVPVDRPSGNFAGVYFNITKHSWRVYGQSSSWDPVENILHPYGFNPGSGRIAGYSEGVGLVSLLLASGEVVLFKEDSEVVIKGKLEQQDIYWIQNFSHNSIYAADRKGIVYQKNLETGAEGKVGELNGAIFSSFCDERGGVYFIDENRVCYKVKNDQIVIDDGVPQSPESLLLRQRFDELRDGYRVGPYMVYRKAESDNRIYVSDDNSKSVVFIQTDFVIMTSAAMLRKNGRCLALALNSSGALFAWEPPRGSF